MEKIIIIGGGGHAKVIISILRKMNSYIIEGYIDKKKSGDLIGIPYLGADQLLPKLFDKGINNAVLGIGQIKSSIPRKNIYKNLIKIGYNLPPIISPDSIINEGVNIDIGTVIMDGSIIGCCSNIGKLCIINTNSSIDHDCQISDFTHIAPGVTISGNVKVGKNVLIGTGANIIQNIEIANNSIISAGSCVLKSIDDSGIYRGNPLQKIKDNEL